MHYVFRVGKSKVNECISMYIKIKMNGTAKRKKRSDAGKTLTNSKKRDEVDTPLNYLKKLKRKQHSGDVLTDAELNQAYANLTAADRLKCVQGAAGLKVQLEKLKQRYKE